MDCRKFSLLTKDFIYDNINDKNDIREFLKHYKTCAECADELEVIYSMYRSLGDIMGPDGTDFSSDYIDELKSICTFHEEELRRESAVKKARIIAGIIITVIMFVALGCLYFELNS